MNIDVPQLNEEQRILQLPDEAAESYFRSLLNKISSAELAAKKESELEEKIDDEELTVQQACVELFNFVQKRNEAIRKTGTEMNESVDETTLEQRAAAIESIKLSEYTPECFLGNGAVAYVYSIISENKNLCVKIVKDFQKHAEENSIHKEAEFLDALSDFEKDGVRTPELKNKLSSIDLTALVMEELDAVNMARVIEGQDELPENFNMEDYFKRLTSYTKALHSEKGVYHLDLVARNLMIDRQTGLPYVIDFGKSKFKADFMGENAGNFEEIYESKDLAGIASARAEIRRWMENGRKPLTKVRF